MSKTLIEKCSELELEILNLKDQIDRLERRNEKMQWFLETLRELLKDA